MIEKQKRDRYEMHKYWGKKPAKNLNTLIEKYSKEGDIVLDPFSGYGVFCCEAFLLNRNVISNDLNPIANFINQQLFATDIDLKKLVSEWNDIKKEFEPFVNDWYELEINGEKKQLVNILRDNNDIPIRVRYKNDNIKSTEETALTNQQIRNYLRFENERKIEDWYPENELISNSRISAKKGMTVANLFTKRTLSCHARLLSLIESHSSGNEKDLLKLAFTANLANCSKLVPPIKSRGDMSQGAWMTGFYIGSTYLENNVLQYFENRLNKIIKGKKDYLNFFDNTLFKKGLSSYSITQYDAKNLKIPSDSIDYIFTDPPYGDAVPYFEQSIIWNSWLKLNPEYEKEIIISDSKTRHKTIESFESEINQAFLEIHRVLKPEGHFSLTYHSLSGVEWKAITNACIKNGFEMVAFEWLVQKTFTPRQINRSKSVKGDILITFRKSQRTPSLILNDTQTKDFFKTEIENWLSITPLETNEVFLRIMEIIFSQRIIIGNINILKILTDNFGFDDNKKWILNNKPKFHTA